MSKWIHHVVIDVESDGPCPGRYNMISFALISLADPARGFLGEVAPIVPHAGIAEARAVSGITFERQQFFAPPKQVMAEARAWLNELTGGRRPIFWSDNPAYDWQFWNWYCHMYLGENPAGFSARRIGDLDAGRRGDPLNTNGWKKRRETPHTHNPLDDARGNAEALRWILAQMGTDVP